MGTVEKQGIYEPTMWGLYPAIGNEPAHLNLHSCGPTNCFDCKIGLAPETFAKMVEDGIKVGKSFTLTVEADNDTEWTPELAEEVKGEN